MSHICLVGKIFPILGKYYEFQHLKFWIYPWLRVGKTYHTKAYLVLQAYLRFETLKAYVLNEPSKSLFRTRAFIEINDFLDCIKNFLF